MPSRRELANAVRALSMDAVQAAKSGHPGMPMGMADIAQVLWCDVLRHDPADPTWANRDRFVLSNGHGSMLLYAALHLLGYEDMTIEELKNFRQLGARTAGHPEFGHAPGVETTTGPLGQGLANGVGMALGERLLNAVFGDEIVDHYTYVLAGDGCMMEGLSHEAISLAGHLKLNKLIVLFDDNEISIEDFEAAKAAKKAALNAAMAKGATAKEVDSSAFASMTLAAKSEDVNEFSLDGAGPKAKRERERKAKEAAKLELGFKSAPTAPAEDRPARAGGRGGRGDRREGAGRGGRGEGRGGRGGRGGDRPAGGGRGGSGLNVKIEDSSAFPTLGGK